jgi:hypothetical protein
VDHASQAATKEPDSGEHHASGASNSKGASNLTLQ